MSAAFLGRIGFHSAAALAAVAFCTAADAATLGLNDSVAVSWTIAVGETDPGENTNETQTQGGDTFTAQEISADAIFEITGFRQSEGEVDLEVKITNTTIDIGNEVGVQKLGVGVDPSLTGISGLTDVSSDDTDVFNDPVADTSPEFANAGMIDFFTATGNGSPNTLREGEMDSFAFTLFFDADNLGNTITLNPFDVKIQTIVPSFELTTTGDFGNGDIPVPASLWLLGSGLIGVGALARRRRR